MVLRQREVINVAVVGNGFLVESEVYIILHINAGTPTEKRTFRLVKRRRRLVLYPSVPFVKVDHLMLGRNKAVERAIVEVYHFSII